MKLKSPEYYLTNGPRTCVEPNIARLAEKIQGSTSREIIENILVEVSKVERRKDPHSPVKFKRTASQILEDGFRTGCTDSGTLFVSLCRAKSILAIQVLTLHLPSARQGVYSNGHAFLACYLKEKGDWVLLDSDVHEGDIEREGFSEKLFHVFNEDKKIIGNGYLIFTCERDYAEFELDGLRIDSIPAINEIHKKVYENYRHEKHQNDEVDK